MKFILLLFFLFIIGCAQDNVFASDAKHFEGLDPIVVAEVLANPIERSRIETKASNAQKNLAQVRVISFIMCRDALRVYQEWLTTGFPSDLRIPPTPTYEEPGWYTWKYDNENIIKSIKTGSIEELRNRLTENGSCAQGVPAQPGDFSGPTIADVVQGKTDQIDGIGEI